MERIEPDAPRVDQTIELEAASLEALREWAIEGTATTAAARVRNPDGQIALVENEWTDGWFVPGGAVEPGESPRRAALREVREETTLDVELGNPLVVLDQTYVDARDGREWFTAEFVCYSAVGDSTIPDASRLGVAGEAIAAARWFDDLPENLHDGELLRPYL